MFDDGSPTSDEKTEGDWKLDRKWATVMLISMAGAVVAFGLLGPNEETQELGILAIAVAMVVAMVSAVAPGVTRFLRRRKRPR